MNDDLISRQAVLDLLFNTYIKTELTSIGYANKEYAELCVDELNELPSVNPQEPKTWRWIEIVEKSAVCSHCYRNNTLYGNYCKWCGARMFVPQESEDKA